MKRKKDIRKLTIPFFFLCVIRLSGSNFINNAYYALHNSVEIFMYF